MHSSFPGHAGGIPRLLLLRRLGMSLLLCKLERRFPKRESEAVPLHGFDDGYVCMIL